MCMTPGTQAGPFGGDRGFKAMETVNKYAESKSKFPGPRFPIGWLRGHVASQHHFVRCAYQRRPASPSFAEAAYIQRIIQRIYDGQDQMGDVA